MRQRISPADVELGMYIVGFGGGWFDHPFWKSGFVLEKPGDLERVRACRVPYVEIDASLGRGVEEAPVLEHGEPQPHMRARRRARGSRPAYKPVQMSPEERRASATVSRSGETMRTVFEQLGSGWRVESAVVEGVLDDIEREIEQDAQTLLQVASLKTKDNYTYLHSIAVCTLMICIARHRGLEREEVRMLGIAGLLHDIGKISISDKILKKPGRLTDEEFASVKSHPVKGYELIKDLPDIPAAALDVCLHHHEKIDGSGYPYGHAEDAISFAARLGAVCDVFDALTSHRSYKEPWTRQKAITRMWSWEGHFDREILFDLMQVLHVYPADSLVRLANGHLALVLEATATGKTVPVLEVTGPLENQATIVRKRQIAREDGERRITSIEEPAAYGSADWTVAADRIRAAAKTSA